MDVRRPLLIRVNDRMQPAYEYWLTAPPGGDFDTEFRPELTPAEMLALGVFGGKYLNDCRGEFPAAWFTTARLSPDRPRAECNLFLVLASLSLAEWRRKGWIWPDDPRGWFQWYCRYWMGRRCPDDGRQIQRWKAMRRHVSQIRNHCAAGDLMCRGRQRQAVLHWAYDSRKI